MSWIPFQAYPKACYGSTCQCILDIVCQWQRFDYGIQHLDYSVLQQKIREITAAGHFIYEFKSYNPNCDSICNSHYIQEGCQFGHKCKIGSSCTNGFCKCTLDFKCYRSHIGNAGYLQPEAIQEQARSNIQEKVILT